MKTRYAPIMAATALTVILSACEQPMTAPKEAIVATVGDEAIGETELNRAVSRLGKLDETESAQVRGKVLEALVDQRLVSGAARSAKLDKEPEVALALQQAQRQVLVEAYMERLFKDMAQPSDSEINDYYTRHPELFSERRIYRIQQLDLQMASSRLPEVEARLKQSRDLADFADWLRSQGIDGKAGVVVKPAEQLPAAILSQLRNISCPTFACPAQGKMIRFGSFCPHEHVGVSAIRFTPLTLFQFLPRREPGLPPAVRH